MHIAKHDRAANPFWTMTEEKAMEDSIIRGEAPQPQPGPAPAEGVPVDAVLDLMAKFADAIRNLQVNVAPAAVTVNPELKMPESEIHETEIKRADPKDGRVMRGSTTTVTRKYNKD
jgi:hypothetical protein